MTHFLMMLAVSSAEKRTQLQPLSTTFLMSNSLVEEECVLQVDNKGRAPKTIYYLRMASSLLALGKVDDALQKKKKKAIIGGSD